MQDAASVYIDGMQEKAYKMSSCSNSEHWWQETMRCHACVVESQLCTRVNTVHSFQEVNRLLPHNLAWFNLQQLSDGAILSRSKVL